MQQQQAPVEQKQIIQKYETSSDGKPLDFSFKGIKNLDELKTLEPRNGRRKPYKEDSETRDDQNSKDIDDELDQKQNDNDNQSQKEDEQEPREDQENVQSQQKPKEKKEEKKVENKQPQIVRVVPQNNTQNLITNSQVPVGGTIKGTNKIFHSNDDTQNQKQKYVVQVRLICSSLILSYNKIRSLDNLRSAVDYVMFPGWKDNLSWIDLSHNFLTTLDCDFNELPRLKSLQLHCNYLSDLTELQKLDQLPLITLTIHGNAIETIKNFRLYIIGILPNLKRLDSVLVSKKERDNCEVWIRTFRNVSLPHIKDPPKPPQDPIQQNNQKL